MKLSKEKIVSLEKATEIVNQWKDRNETIVFTNGCFDIVHLGHIDYLEKARNLGQRLIVGINSDDSVKHLKGNSRPVVVEYARLRMISAMEFVDAVILFDEETPAVLIKNILPDILVKGDDYTIDNIVGADIVIKNGGSVKTIELVKGYSTSNIIKFIKNI